MTIIKVKAAELNDITAKLEAEIKTLYAILERAKRNGNSLVDSWQSPAQQILSDKFRVFSNHFEQFRDDISVYPEFLHFVVANYSNVDKTTENKLSDYTNKKFDFTNKQVYTKDASANYVFEEIKADNITNENTSSDNVSNDDINA